MSIKIISINIQGGQLLENFLKFIEIENPDVILMQEVFTSDNSNDPKYDILNTLRMFGFAYAHHAVTYDTKRNSSVVKAGNAVVSKYPFNNPKVYFYEIPYISNYEEPTRDFSKVPRNLQHVEIPFGKKRLNVLNTHGIWGIDGKDSPARLNMSKVILDNTINQEHVILGGDFNMDPNTIAIKSIEKSLTNVFKGYLKSTFNMKRKTKPLFENLVVDIIFVSQNIKIISKKCPPVDISDHLPLVIEIAI